MSYTLSVAYASVLRATASLGRARVPDVLRQIGSASITRRGAHVALDRLCELGWACRIPHAPGQSARAAIYTLTETGAAALADAGDRDELPGRPGTRVHRPIAKEPARILSVAAPRRTGMFTGPLAGGDPAPAREGALDYMACPSLINGQRVPYYLTAPTLPAARGSLPPEGALPALGRPGGGHLHNRNPS